MSSQNIAGVGLLILQAATDAFDPYFEGQESPVSVHGNIQISPNDEGIVVMSCKMIDRIDDLYLVFDPTDENYPFEGIALNIGGLPVWGITAKCAQLLNEVSGPPASSISPQELIIRLPLWLSKEYYSNHPAPEKMAKECASPYFTYGLTMIVQVDGARVPFKLGAHVSVLSNKPRIAAMALNKEVPIDRWAGNQYTYDALSSLVLDTEIILPPSDPVTSIKFANTSASIATDILFCAVDIAGEPIPIRTLRALRKDGTELLCVNTSLLRLDGGHSSPNGYLYSHLPGKLNLGRLDLDWEVEFFTPVTFATMFVYPRIWNILRFADKAVDLKFLD